MGQIFSSKFFLSKIVYWLLFILISIFRMHSRLHFKNKIKFSTNFSLYFGNEVHRETGRYSTMPTVISATVSAEHDLKHNRETTKRFPVKKNVDVVRFALSRRYLFWNKKYLYRTIEQVLYVCKYYIWYERLMQHGNSCHAEASYYSSETWLRTQNGTAATRITHLMGKRIQSKLQTAVKTVHSRKLALTVFNTWNSSETSELRER